MANYGFMEKHPGIDLGELDIATALLLMQQTNGKEDAGESRGRHGKGRKGKKMRQLQLSLPQLSYLTVPGPGLPAEIPILE